MRTIIDMRTTRPPAAQPLARDLVVRRIVADATPARATTPFCGIVWEPARRL